MMPAVAPEHLATSQPGGDLGDGRPRRDRRTGPEAGPGQAREVGVAGRPGSRAAAGPPGPARRTRRGTLAAPGRLRARAGLVLDCAARAADLAARGRRTAGRSP